MDFATIADCSGTADSADTGVKIRGFLKDAVRQKRLVVPEASHSMILVFS